jgi:hypothetical protein
LISWGALQPINPDTYEFVYVPIPEEKETRPEYKKTYDQFIVPCQNLGQVLPRQLLSRFAHLDPDFLYLTYGDEKSKGERIKIVQEGDVLAFYSGLKPIKPCEHKLIYALIGLYVVDKVLSANQITKKDWDKNAHTRKRVNETDVVVFAKPGLSGRLERCIPIGEFRNGAYRVRKELLDKWGGLKVEDGFIQRSATLPWLCNPEKFYDWFKKQNVMLIAANNKV